jgi:hypothetical protein
MARINKDIERQGGFRVVAALVIALVIGLALRQVAYDHTQSMRREITQRNTFYWGDQIVRRAHPSPGPAAWGSLCKSYLEFYDVEEVRESAAPMAPRKELTTLADPNVHVLDFVPLRLLMAAAWVNYVNIHFGPATEWRPEFARSYASFSMVMELLAAIAIFVLVARCLKRANSDSSHRLLARWSRHEAAGAVAIALWLNPASIIDSHVWPHGQTWVLPFYLFAMLAMIESRYFLAGVIFGLGAMFKGQMIIVSPVLIMWPIFDRRWSAAVKVVLGMAIAIAVVTSPWLIHGSFAWAKAGFAANVDFNDVLRKERVLNLPAALAILWHMSLHQHLLDTDVAGLHLTLELKTALVLLYVLLLTLTVLGITRLARSRDCRWLVAIAAPWALMFFILGQMDERYLVWGACFSAGAIVVSWRALTGHLLLTCCAIAGELESLLYEKPNVHPQLMHWLHRMDPLTLSLTAVGVAILFLEATRCLLSRNRTMRETSSELVSPEKLLAQVR